MLSGEQNTGTWLERDALRLSAERMEVQWHGQAVPLTVTELWIVHSLARRPGHVRSRQQLMDDANILVDDQTITSHVKRIRRKFKMTDESFDKLATVYGAGYRWNSSAG
jgi:two-component system OmpR family response regulator